MSNEFDIDNPYDDNDNDNDDDDEDDINPHSTDDIKISEIRMPDVSPSPGLSSVIDALTTPIEIKCKDESTNNMDIEMPPPHPNPIIVTGANMVTDPFPSRHYSVEELNANYGRTYMQIYDEVITNRKPAAAPFDPSVWYSRCKFQLVEFEYRSDGTRKERFITKTETILNPIDRERLFNYLELEWDSDQKTQLAQVMAISDSYRVWLANIDLVGDSYPTHTVTSLWKIEAKDNVNICLNTACATATRDNKPLQGKLSRRTGACLACGMIRSDSEYTENTERRNSDSEGNDSGYDTDKAAKRQRSYNHYKKNSGKSSYQDSRSLLYRCRSLSDLPKYIQDYIDKGKAIIQAVITARALDDNTLSERSADITRNANDLLLLTFPRIIDDSILSEQQTISKRLAYALANTAVCCAIRCIRNDESARCFHPLATFANTKFAYKHRGMSGILEYSNRRRLIARFKEFLRRHQLPRDGISTDIELAIKRQMNKLGFKSQEIRLKPTEAALYDSIGQLTLEHQFYIYNHNAFHYVMYYWSTQIKPQLDAQESLVEEDAAMFNRAIYCVDKETISTNIYTYAPAAAAAAAPATASADVKDVKPAAIVKVEPGPPKPQFQMIKREFEIRPESFNRQSVNRNSLFYRLQRYDSDQIASAIILHTMNSDTVKSTIKQFFYPLTVPKMIDSLMIQQIQQQQQQQQQQTSSPPQVPAIATAAVIAIAPTVLLHPEVAAVAMVVKNKRSHANSKTTSSVSTALATAAAIKAERDIERDVIIRLHDEIRQQKHSSSSRNDNDDDSDDDDSADDKKKNSADAESILFKSSRFNCQWLQLLFQSNKQTMNRIRRILPDIASKIKLPPPVILRLNSVQCMLPQYQETERNKQKNINRVKTIKRKYTTHNGHRIRWRPDAGMRDTASDLLQRMANNI
jgi:hypothetical protein